MTDHILAITGIPKLRPEFKPLFLAALRSGDYQQGRNVLRTPDDKFCCLGVACDVALKNGFVTGCEWELNLPSDGYSFQVGVQPDSFAASAIAVLPSAVFKAIFQPQSMVEGNPRIRFPRDLGTLRMEGKIDGIATANDEGMTFEEIADMIEEQW